MSAGFLFRPAEPDDAEQIAALRKRADLDKKNKYPPLDPYGGDYPTVEHQREEMAQHVACFVAVIGVEVVGFGICSAKDQLPGFYRIDFSVDPLVRGQGIGTTLVARLIMWAQAHSEVETLLCQFARADRSKRNILENAGFKVARVAWVDFMPGARYNAIDMVMEIR